MMSQKDVRNRKQGKATQKEMAIRQDSKRTDGQRQTKTGRTRHVQQGRQRIVRDGEGNQNMSRKNGKEKTVKHGQGAGDGHKKRNWSKEQTRGPWARG